MAKRGQQCSFIKLDFREVLRRRQRTLTCDQKTDRLKDEGTRCPELCWEGRLWRSWRVLGGHLKVPEGLNVVKVQGDLHVLKALSCLKILNESRGVRVLKVLASHKVLWSLEVLKVLGVPKDLGSKGSGGSDGSEGFKLFRCVKPVNVNTHRNTCLFRIFTLLC